MVKVDRYRTPQEAVLKERRFGLPRFSFLQNNLSLIAKNDIPKNQRVVNLKT